MPKKLMLLGGSRYLIPVIEAAQKRDIYVITCDYLPENYAHAYADEYIDVSIVDHDAVLEAAKAKHIEGIMSFAADPGVVTAAFVAEKLELPFQGSYEAVSILQNKDAFRNFLAANDFNCPAAFVVRTFAEAERKVSQYPVMVKPVDSAGSKGCTRVEGANQLKEAVEYALSFSCAGKCIIEEFIEKQGHSSDADGFTIDGIFKCVSFSSQYFDQNAPNVFAPAGFAMPSDMPITLQNQLVADLQRLSDLLDLRSGVYNIETRIGSDGKPYIMELSPRGGGNRLCEMLRFASGVDLIDAAVCAAVGFSADGVAVPHYADCWYQEILHSDRPGTWRGIDYDLSFWRDHVIDEQVWINPGEHVEGFKAANDTLGSIMMRFKSQQELNDFLENKNEYIRLEIDPS